MISMAALVVWVRLKNMHFSNSQSYSQADRRQKAISSTRWDTGEVAFVFYFDIHFCSGMVDNCKSRTVLEKSRLHNSGLNSLKHKN